LILLFFFCSNQDKKTAEVSLFSISLNLDILHCQAAAAAPYGQNQHVSSNPSTVLISTTSNSLMSASVKPSTQPIGAIGSKGYQTSAPPPPPQVGFL
jgi:hypothetical protein